MKIPKVGDRVTVTDGSSDGHVGTVVNIKKTCIRIKLDVGGSEVDVSNYYIHYDKFQNQRED